MGEPGATFFSLDDDIIEIERFPQHIIEHTDPVIIHSDHTNVFESQNVQTLYAGSIYADRIFQKNAIF